MLIAEIELRKAANYVDNNYRVIASRVGMSYSGFIKWVKNDDRGMSDSRLDKVADSIGKKIILVDK